MIKHDIIMGMPVTIEITDKNAKEKDSQAIFSYLTYIDRTFSTYKFDSEMMRINRGELLEREYSPEMKKILLLAEQTKRDTDGYFDIGPKGNIDPSGLVKGYAIHQAANQLEEKGYKNFYITIAGDSEIRGKKNRKRKWTVGIENPFNRKEIVKVVSLQNNGIATSGTYIRGKHIYNPKLSSTSESPVISLTVIGPNVYEADRFATAAFAMGDSGISFLNQQQDLEAYMILKDRTAVYTLGFEKFVLHS